jgi:hypothetical protein
MARFIKIMTKLPKKPISSKPPRNPVAKDAQYWRHLAVCRKNLIRQDKANCRLAKVVRELQRKLREQRLTTEGAIAMIVKSVIMAFPEGIHHANA